MLKLLHVLKFNNFKGLLKKSLCILKLYKLEFNDTILNLDRHTLKECSHFFFDFKCLFKKKKKLKYFPRKLNSN